MFCFVEVKNVLHSRNLGRIIGNWRQTEEDCKSRGAHWWCAHQIQVSSWNRKNSKIHFVRDNSGKHMLIFIKKIDYKDRKHSGSSWGSVTTRPRLPLKDNCIIMLLSVIYLYFMCLFTDLIWLCWSGWPVQWSVLCSRCDIICTSWK